MTDWNAAKPAGDEAWQIGDDFIRDNNAALEEALVKLCIFPGNAGNPNRGRAIFEEFDDVPALNSGIPSPQLGFRVWLTDHRQPFYHDGATWRAFDKGYGTLAERDAITQVIPGARWIASDSWPGAEYEYIQNVWQQRNLVEQYLVPLTDPGPVTFGATPEPILTTPNLVVPDQDDHRFMVTAFARLTSANNSNNNKTVEMRVEYDQDGDESWVQLPHYVLNYERYSGAGAWEFYNATDVTNILDNPNNGVAYRFRIVALGNFGGNATDISLEARLVSKRG